MKKFCSFSLILLFLLFIFAQSSAENQVWSRVEALSKSIFETKDSLALEEMVSKKVTYGHSGGNVEDKVSMVKNTVASKTIYKNSLFERVSVDVDGKTAIVRHNFRATTIINGTEAPLDINLLQVWKKEKGKWRLWARQAVRIPKP